MASLVNPVTYSPPTILSPLRNLEKIYFIPQAYYNSICLVFTDEKTKQVVEKIFQGDKDPTFLLPKEDKIDKSKCLKHTFDPTRNDAPLFRPLFRIVAYLEVITTKIPSEIQEPRREVPILLVFQKP